jgi:hypothetical protein
MSRSRKHVVLKQLRELRSDLVEKLKTNPRDRELTDLLHIVQKQIRDITSMTEEGFLPIYQRRYAHIVTAILILLFSITGFAQTDTTYTLPKLPALVRAQLDYGLGNPFPFEVYRFNQCGEMEMTSKGLIRGISVTVPVQKPGTYAVRLLHPEAPRYFTIAITPFDVCEAGHYITVKSCDQ